MNDQYQIEWYSPKLGTPIVSLAEYGLVFNKAAAEALHYPSRIRLGFDKNKLIIAVRPVDNDDQDSFQFSERERKGFIRINSKDFIRFISRFISDIKLDKAVRFLSRYDEINELLIVDLRQPIDTDNNVAEEEL